MATTQLDSMGCGLSPRARKGRAAHRSICVRRIVSTMPPDQMRTELLVRLIKFMHQIAIYLSARADPQLCSINIAFLSVHVCDGLRPTFGQSK